MYLLKSGKSEVGERHHVFVAIRPAAVPAGWSLVEDVSLTAHPLPDDPDAPTVRVLLYRDPNAPSQYHYLLSREQAKHLRRVGGTPFVYHSWEEFARVHPTVLAENGLGL